MMHKFPQPSQMLQGLLDRSSARHSHLCPRQILGIRAGLYGGALLELDLPRLDKRLLVISETDGCFVDGLEVATGVSVGRRTLRIEDYGKVAAVFVDTMTGQAVRVIPHPDSRLRAQEDAHWHGDPYAAQLQAYPVMAVERLLVAYPVMLLTPIQRIVSEPGKKAICTHCGEEILNEREVILEGKTLCRSCASPGFYLRSGTG